MERYPNHRLPRHSRVAVGVSTLVLNVMPWDGATYPSGEVPEHFVPYDFVLEEVAAYLAPDTWTFQYALERHERDAGLDDAKRSLHTVAETVKSPNGYHTDITTQGVVEGTQCVGLTLHSTDSARSAFVHDIGISTTWRGPNHDVYTDCPYKIGSRYGRNGKHRNLVVCICASHGKAFVLDKSAPTVIAGRLDIPRTLLPPYHLVVSLYGGDPDASWTLTDVDEDDFLQRHTALGCFDS